MFEFMHDENDKMKPTLEQLESRLLLTSYVVDTTVDESDGDYSAGDLSLREAIELANADAAEDTITFSTVAFDGGGTIALTQGELQIDESLDIHGTGNGIVTIDADENNRVFIIYDSNVQMSYLTIQGGRQLRGAGIYADGADLELSNVTVKDNISDDKGGGIYLREATLLVQNSTISDNASDGDGGGIYARNSTQSFLNSTISHNTADTLGGGVFLYASDTLISHSTVVFNEAGNRGGGIASVSVETGSSDLRIHNSIVLGNIAGEDDDVSATFDTGTYTLIGDAGSSGGLIDGIGGNIIGVANVGAVLDAGLGDHGGSTRTHALIAGSLAVDVGSNAEATNAGLTTDQRGMARPFNVTVDMGAFELGTAPAYDLSLSGDFIAEDAVDDDPVGTVSVTGVAPANYSLTMIDDAGGRFEIDAVTGVITVKVASLVNYEDSDQHHVIVQLTENGGVTYARSFMIEIVDVNEPLIDLTLSHDVVAADGLNGDRVATVHVLDTDLPGADIYTYTLLDNAGGRFDVDTSGEISIGNAALIDFDNATSHQIQLQVIDNAGHTLIETFDIDVIRSRDLHVDTEVDESDGDYSLGDFSLREALSVSDRSWGKQTITFEDTVNTIVLGGTQLEVQNDVSILGRDSGYVEVNGADDSRVFYIYGGVDVYMTRLTIADGFAAYADLNGRGGGILLETATLTLEDVIVENNEADDGGVKNNYSYGNGGGINARLGSVLTIRDSVIRDNLADQAGGGFNAAQSSLLLENSTIQGNQARSGGAMSGTKTDELTIRNTSVLNNVTSNWAGGIWFSREVTGNIVNTTVAGNVAENRGGGFHAFLSDVTITNTTFSHNVSNNGAGGGISLNVSDLVLLNSTLVGNVANNGGAINVIESDDNLSHLALHNNLLAGNTGRQNFNEVADPIDVGSYNVIGDADSSGGLAEGVNGNIIGVGGVGVRDINTIVDTTLRDNGGPTKTHALLNGSAAIGAGDVSLLPADTHDIDGDLDISESLPLDQNGRDRIIGSLDIGAVEHVDWGLRLFSENHLSFMENSADAVVQIDAGSVNSSDLTYQIIGGADQSLFSINGAEVFFVSPPDYETPLDHNGNNVYQVKVSVSDGVIVKNQMLYINVLNNGSPIITSAGRGHITENATGPVYTVAGSDPEGDSLTYSIEGGQDQGLFSINGSGEIRFITPPDYETPLDHNGNNIYIVKIGVSDGENLKTKTIYIDVYNNRMPVIISPARGNIVENDTAAVYTVAGTDPDGDTLSYTIEGGHDASLFSINGSGEIRFITPPDYETPLDHNGNNIYIVKIGVSDGENLKTKTIYIDVYNNRMPVITSPARGGITEDLSGVAYSLTATDLDDEEADLVYSIEGGQDASLFTMDIDGNISFISAPDFESPLDHNGNNVYIVKVGVSDGENLKTKTIYIDVYNAAG